MVTWTNTDVTGTPRNIQAGDNFAYAQTVDSSIVALGTMTNVQFILEKSSATTTISCCRWATTETMNTGSPATCLAAANHTYWSMSASDLPVSMSMTSQTVTPSTANVAGNAVGLVLSGSNTNIVKLGRSTVNQISTDLIHVDVATASQDLPYTSGFIMTVGSSPPPSLGGRLPPPPIVLGGL